MGRIITKAHQYPLCTQEVFDALCCHPNCPFLQDDSELPQRLFRHLMLIDGASEWTEHDHPLPFLKYLYNLSSIRAPKVISNGNHYYPFTQAIKANFLPLISFLLDHCGDTNCAVELLLLAAVDRYEAVVKLLLVRDGLIKMLNDW